MKAAPVLETGKVLMGESYAGQMVCMTYPLIWDYGINRMDDQSEKAQVQGFIVKEAARNPSHWQMEKNLSRTLAQAGVVGIKGLDTRALTRIIREHGVLRGVITTETEHLSELIPRVKAWLVWGSGRRGE